MDLMNKITKRKIMIVATSTVIFVIFIIIISIFSMENSKNKNQEKNSSDNSQKIDTSRLDSPTANPEAIKYSSLSGQNDNISSDIPILSNFEWLEINKGFANSDVRDIKTRITDYITVNNQKSDELNKINWVLFDYNNVVQENNKTTFLVDYYIYDIRAGHYKVVFSDGELTLDDVKI